MVQEERRFTRFKEITNQSKLFRKTNYIIQYTARGEIRAERRFNCLTRSSSLRDELVELYLQAPNIIISTTPFSISSVNGTTVSCILLYSGLIARLQFRDSLEA
jgi:hypothetical protein